MSSQLIVALDFNNQRDALNCVEQLNPAQCALKVGNELFSLLGPMFIKVLTQKGYRVFLDLKFHDIPNTVAHACKVCSDLGVWMINLHALGGYKMMHAARQAIESYGHDRPRLIAVTVLTSFSEHDLQEIGLGSSIQEQAIHLSTIAKDADLDGVVCSAHEVQAMKSHFGANWITVTPGIRLTDSTKEDQHRVMTPFQAAKAGSDYLVVGRPITQSNKPCEMVSLILDEINAAR